MDISLLNKNFGANSANNEMYQDLWIKNASLFIPQLNCLFDVKSKIYNVSDFEMENSEKLSNIFNKYNSDKSTVHNYYIVYNYILNKLGVNSNLNLLEIGIGTNNPSLVSTMGYYGTPGASLRTWSEYLPNSRIYGGDVDKNILFTDENNRINTSYVDQLNLETYKVFSNIKYDLIIDDGLHSIGANLNTLIFGLNQLKLNGWIVIEDISEQFLENWYVVDYILRQKREYKTYLVKTKTAYMYLVNFI